ncbi:hypothetical protein GFY24_24320 [Nocardia sp. SYP-A9097]|uniref:hypothetical protein n=1 Tax=Nocardia sp. SYP-A9097 TaxID=2663237 RepID=UPI00129AB517|nr:hypothetical protein [Nocardia sp. SYP-A9097]MRH90531.1 hypothetical protein [Nocardia sp. SYP-A9097]
MTSDAGDPQTMTVGWLGRDLLVAVESGTNTGVQGVGDFLLELGAVVAEPPAKR